MPELIDRQATIDKICGYECSVKLSDCPIIGEDSDDYCDHIRIIMEQPVIEPEVRRGRWISRRAEFGTGIMYECSVCHEICEHYTHIHYDPSPYCMYCGAKMKEDADNTMAEMKLCNCPFCGSDNVKINYPYSYLESSVSCVQCYGCGCTTAVFDSEDKAIEAWNQRCEE